MQRHGAPVCRTIHKQAKRKLAESAGSRFISLAKEDATHKMRFAFAYANGQIDAKAVDATVTLKDIFGNHSTFVESGFPPGASCFEPSNGVWRFPLTDARPFGLDKRRSSRMRGAIR
jgi:hypothetical protein